jgi:hypothetical protein
MAHNEELILRFEQSAAAMEDALRNVPEAALDRSPGPGKWSIRQLAAHLADAEVVSSGRLRWVAAQPGCELKAFDQDKWAEGLAYDRQSPQEDVELVRALRRVSARMLRSLPDIAWKNVGKHEERGNLTLRDLVEGICSHTESHAEQIRKLKTQYSVAA